ncbi:MAG: hypothetical protein WDM86_18640 [Rhizomicrobium sp.]
MADSFAPSASIVVKTTVGLRKAPSANFAVALSRKRESRTTRRGEWRSRPRDAAGQFRIVGQSGADAHQDRVVARAQEMSEAAGLRAGDPFAVAG